jgi:hypothetical protein
VRDAKGIVPKSRVVSAPTIGIIGEPKNQLSALLLADHELEELLSNNERTQQSAIAIEVKIPICSFKI